MVSSRALLALFGVGISAFVFSGEALAAKGLTFTPTTSWAVSRIEPTNGGAAYCTLARRFKGNTVLTFARNEAGEGTVAIDFQQSLFDPNQTYRIGLQAGASGLKREFMTRPATPNAIVLRTGQDPKFFNTLNENAELGVFLDQTRHTFSVPDFAAGQAQLTTCIGSAPTPVIAPPPPAAADAQAMATLRAEIEALRQENAQVVASLKGQGGTVTTQAPAIAAALPDTAENTELVSKLTALESEKSTLVDNLQNERARQQQEAQDEAALQKALEDQKALKDMLEAERQQRAQLESAMSEKTAEAEKRGELKARIDALEASNSELKTLRETLDTERGKRLAAEKQLQDQKATLMEQETLRARVSELENQNKSLQETAVKVEAMKVDLEDTGTRALMEQARREAAEKALQQMQVSSSENKASMARLQQQLADASKNMEAAEAAKEAELSKKHADEVARLNAEMAKLREQSTASEEMMQKVAAEQARREATEKELNEMRDALAAERAEAAKIRAAARDDVKTKEQADRLAELEGRNADLMDQLQTAKSRVEAAETAAVTTSSNDPQTNEKIAELGRKAEADRRELQALLEAETARREKLEGIMAKGDTDARVKEMDSQIDELQERNASLEKRLRDEQGKIAPAAGGESDQVATLRKQLEILKGDNEMLAGKLAGAGRETGRAAQVVYTGDDALAEDLAESKSSLASVMAERDEYRDLLQRERQNVKEDGKPSKDKKGAGTNARIEALEAERVDLIRQLEFERARLEQVASGKEAPPAGASESDLSGKLAAVEAEKARLKKQLDVAQRDVIEAREKAFAGIAPTDEDVADLLRENRKLQAELAASGSSGNADVRAMETEIASLRAQNNVLSEEINKRLAAAPSRAQMDNAAAEANFKMGKAGTRMAAVESENIRLSKELAVARKGMAPIVSNDQPMATFTPASVSSSEVGPSGQDIASYLKRAGIPMVSGFEKIRKMSNPQFGAFRWDTGVVFGTAEQQSIQAQAFEQAVNAYLAKTRARCSGTYDQAFDAAQMANQQNFAVADVACVMPDGTGAGAAMVFFYKDGMFNAVAHEGDISAFDQAMTTRDSLAHFMNGVL